MVHVTAAVPTARLAGLSVIPAADRRDLQVVVHERGNVRRGASPSPPPRTALRQTPVPAVRAVAGMLTKTDGK